MQAANRILYVSGMGGVGGVETHLLQISRLVDRATFEPVFIVPNHGGLTQALRDEGVRVYELSLDPIKRQLFPAIKATRAIIKQERPAIVHAHATVGGIISRLALTKADRRVIVSVFTHHGFGYRDMVRTLKPRGLQKLKQWSIIELEYVLDNLTDHLISVSESDRQRALNYRYIPHPRITFIPNGIAQQAQVSQQEIAATRNAIGCRVPGPLVGTVARLVTQKGIPDMLHAFAEVHTNHPEVTFLIVGGGPLLLTLQKRAQELGLADAVVFLGEQANPYPYLRAMDIFVCSSLWEGSPYALLEAMACGIPVAATAVNGIPEMVGTQAGLLSPVGNPRRLAGSILQLLDNRALREQLGAQGRAACARRLSAASSVKRLEQLYRRLLQA